MDRYCVEQLNAMCTEIYKMTESNPEMVSMVIEGYYQILKFAEIGRKEGLLALEEAVEEIVAEESCMTEISTEESCKTDDTQSAFINLIMLIVDGIDPEIVRTVGINRYAAANQEAYHGLMNLMYIQGALMIQAGNNIRVISEVIKSMMPAPIIDELHRRDSENACPDGSKEFSQEDMIKSLCSDNREIDEKDHSIVSELSKTLVMFSNKEVQRLLSETDNDDITVAMKGMPGKARARIFENLSPRCANEIAEKNYYLGPVRMKDVEEACAQITRILLDLYDMGEYSSYDLAILRVVTDMYYFAQKEYSERMAKYEELKSVIDRMCNY